jgi:hypothetical protein
LDCNQLAYKFPETAEEIELASENFNSISTNKAIIGCVAAIDGFLLKIKVPRTSEVGHVKSFFSGHYQCYGINIQAACDYRSQFVEVAIAAPGGSNDMRAYQKSKLAGKVSKLPIGKIVIGDSDYGCSKSLLTPFSGSKKTN